jgi:ubiquinone/menaquinone biosynthesis C-methylase UbiE
LQWILFTTNKKKRFEMNEMAIPKSPISRVMRSKDQAKTNYDRLSKIYDLLAGSSERQYIDRGLQKLDLKSGEIVLDIGFGTGYAIGVLARAVSDSGKVYGIDISEGMLSIAQRNIENSGLSERVELKCEDATKLPYETDYFDAVFVSFTLELFDTPEIPILLEECHRVLKSGARICVIAMSKEDEPGIAVRLYEWMHKKFPVTVDCRPIYVQDVLREAGFRVEEVEKQSMWGLPIEIVMAKENS